MTLCWIIGMPLFGLLMLIKNRKRLRNANVLSKYRILYIGLKSEYYFWEFVNTFRKVSLLILNVFIEYVMYKVLSSIGLLVVVLFIQNRIKPYQERFFNHLEQREMIASISFLCSGILYQQSINVDWLTWAGLILAVILNVQFFAFWLQILFI